MADKYLGIVSDTVSSPARQAFAITPSDTNVIDPLPKSIICGGAGNIVLKAVDSTGTVTIPVQAGQQLDIRAEKVLSTGTTATNIIGLA